MTLGSFRAVKGLIGEIPTRFRQRHLGTLKNRSAFRPLVATLTSLALMTKLYGQLLLGVIETTWAGVTYAS